MASTAISSEEEKREYFDSPKELDEKVSMLAEMVIMSQHMTVFTGAGISTACGIPDYRSGFNTVMPTGPGCWETAANKDKYNAMINDPKKKAATGIKTQISKAKPSLTHMGFVELMERGHLKHVISQNVDGLHRRSGIDPHRLSEVHGNTNLEICKKCGKEYMRDFRVRTAQKVHSHETGRKCEDPNCKGDMIDTIINFGENLNKDILDAGFQNGAMSDLCVAMGSSLRVTPAADMPSSVQGTAVTLSFATCKRLNWINMQLFASTLSAMISCSCS